jgi:hypothetical protein
MKSIWVISATMSKHTETWTATKAVMGYRVSSNKDEAIGSFTKKMLEEWDEYSIGELLVLEIPFEAVRTVYNGISPEALLGN